MNVTRNRYLRPRNILLVLLGIGTVAYVQKRRGVDPQTLSSGPAEPVIPGFVEHRDTLGFTLQRPDEWAVTAPSLSDISITSADGSAAALIRARVARGDLARWVTASFPGTERSMRDVRVTRATTIAPDVASATLTFHQNGEDKLASLVAVRRGDIATIFVGAARARDFNAQLPVLTQILESFRFVPPNSSRAATPRPAARLQFVRWIDPYEQAFSFEIPQDWQPQGGLMRTGSGAHAVWQINAPDGAAFIYGGDQNVPAYFVFPTETAISLGNREGYPTGPNGPVMLRFQDAASMGQTLIGRRFGQVQIAAVRERPDLLEGLRRNPVFQGSVPRMSAAEIEFRLQDGRTGMLALTTYGQEVNGLGGTWYVDNVHGFVAPSPRVSETAMALAQAVGTSRENPQWRAGEADHQQRMSAQYQEYYAWSSNLQRETIKAQWASDQSRQADMRDILGGTVRLEDPVTGEVFETAGTSRYYYRVVNGAPNTGVGVDTDYNPLPEIDMRRLLQVGVDTPR
ncbi:MAG: hypothetical protein ABI613_02655 [Gemmatimonadota bacterium]